MNKKEYLVKLLELLKGAWKPAEGFLIVLEEGFMDDKMTDMLVQIIESGLQNAEQELDQSILSSSLNTLDKIKEIEKQEKEIESKELDSLLGELENI